MNNGQRKYEAWEDAERVEERWQREVQKINRGLYIVWDKKINRWRLKHEDERTGLIRNVFLVEDKDGKYEDLNMGVVRLLRQCVLWDLVHKYPDPKDLYQHIVEEHAKEKKAEESRRKGYLIDFNRDHRRQWRAALENARSGRFDAPEEIKRKIIIH